MTINIDSVIADIEIFKISQPKTQKLPDNETLSYYGKESGLAFLKGL